MTESVLINWDNLTKCTLVITLGLAAHLTWIVWYVAVFNHPSLNHWLNSDFYEFNLSRMVFSCLLYLVLLYLCIYWREKKWIIKYLPLLVLIHFSTSFIYAGYSIGISSPVTTSGYISILMVALILFERKLVYLLGVPITCFIYYAMVTSGTGQLAYAPVFSEELNNSVVYFNNFWVFSQIYFFTPIFVATFLLFEVLIIQWKNREKQIKIMSQIDSLTGLFNRRKVAIELTKANELQHDYALILLDLDHFKSINDNYGHHIGDRVLQRVAKILRLNLDKYDLAGRFGGEEFVLILKNCNLIQALDVAERCRKLIEREIFDVDHNKTIRISASFGVSLSEVGLSNEAVIRNADQALYFAKKRGRNQVRNYYELAQYVEQPNMHS